MDHHVECLTGPSNWFRPPDALVWTVPPAHESLAELRPARGPSHSQGRFRRESFEHVPGCGVIQHFSQFFEEIAQDFIRLEPPHPFVGQSWIKWV